jgi:methyl-accepting chemotaxis protein
MLGNFKTKSKLTLLSFIAILVMILLGIFVIINLKKVSNSLETVYKDRVIPLEQLKIIADEYAVNIVDTTHQTRNGNFEFEKCIENINLAKTKIEKNWQAYISTTLTKDEEILVKDTQKLMINGNEIAEKIKTACQNKDSILLTKITVDELYKKIDPIGEKISALISLQLEVAKQETESAYDIYETSKTIVLFTILISLIIISILSYLIINDISEKLIKFKEGLLSFFSYLNREKSNVNLLNINSTDEFGDMANVINQNIIKTKNLIEEDNQLIEEAKTVMTRVINGWYSQLIENKTQNTSLEEFKNNVNKMIQETKTRFVHVNNVLDSYSENDFRPKLKMEQNDEKNGVFEYLVIGLNNLQDTLTNMLVENKLNGLKLSENSNVLLTNVDKLNVSSNEAAASLEQTAASLEQITSNIRSNTENIAKMSTYSNSVTYSAKEGEKLANETTLAMDEINIQVNSINEAIAVIDQIAFQTNILSLNAAVEAATAGEAGRGFAVVAQEVRNLANRSAEAAREIKNIVENATKKANDGKEIAGYMIEGYKELNKNILNTINLISDIEMSSKEQLTGIEQINCAVTQLDQQTQQNAVIASQTHEVAITTDTIAKIILTNVDSKEFLGKDEVKINSVIDNETNVSN